MQFSDHKILAMYLINYGNSKELMRHKYAFVLGSVMPDANIFTYVKGFLKGRPFQMHYTVNLQSVIQRKMKYLAGKRKFTWLDYFRLGVLTHFLADTFTYPHNEIFHGNMIEHAIYEGKMLHPIFQNAVLQKITELEMERKQNMWDIWCNAHEKYMETQPSPWVDIRYIVSVCQLVCEQLIPAEEQAAFKFRYSD